jgi:hypothetical protein
VLSETNSVFSGESNSDSNEDCDALYFEAFSDSSLSTVWSDARVVMSAMDSITPNPTRSDLTAQSLTVDTSSSYSLSFYLKAYNSGQNSNSAVATVVVCGNEQVSGSSDYENFSI